MDTSYKNIINSLQEEFQIHSLFSHPNIIKVLSSDLHTQTLLMVPDAATYQSNNLQYINSKQDTQYLSLVVDCYVMEYAKGGGSLYKY